MVLLLWGHFVIKMQAPNWTAVISYSQTGISIMHPFIQGLNNISTQTDFGIVDPAFMEKFIFLIYEKAFKMFLKNPFSHFVIRSISFNKH